MHRAAASAAWWFALMSQNDASGNRGSIRWRADGVEYNGCTYKPLECSEQGAWSTVYHLHPTKSSCASPDMVLKVLRSKYFDVLHNHTDKDWNDGHLGRLHREVSYQRLASERGLAPVVLDFGSCSDAQGRAVQYILMERHGTSLAEMVFSLLGHASLEKLKFDIAELYRSLQNVGLIMKDISLENIVRDDRGKLLAIDFDPAMVDLVRNDTSELMETIDDLADPLRNFETESTSESES